MLVQRVLILLWKYLLVKEEELFYWWKVSKFLLAALFANARRVDVSKFRVENTAILRLRPRKLIFLLFSKINKRLFARRTYIRLLIYLKAIYGQKIKEIDFSTLATRWSIFPDRRSYMQFILTAGEWFWKWIGKFLKREYVSTEMNCWQISVIVHPSANKLAWFKRSLNGSFLFLD